MVFGGLWARQAGLKFRNCNFSRANHRFVLTERAPQKRPDKIRKRFFSPARPKMGDPNLVTTINFHGQEFLFKMNVVNNNLEILITDKNSGEEWQCSYDATYIENLTHKTGNFKQFEIFVTMIKSGLLRTSECVSLDLLTYEDLEALRSRKLTKACGTNNANKRYLIVTYCVEFDKIRYPLPLEYCGPPDPIILQGTIRRLELELARTKEELALKSNNSDSRKLYFLQKRVDELTDENVQLQAEIRHLKKQLEARKPKCHVATLQKAVNKLEKSVLNERSSRHEFVEKLRNDNMALTKELEKVKRSEMNLKSKMHRTASHSPSRMCYGDFSGNVPPTKRKSNQSIRTMYRNKSPYTNTAKSNYGPKPRCSRADVRRTHSRSSSNSSAKYSEPHSGDNMRTPCSTPRLSKRNTPQMRSRSSSVASNGSSKGSAKPFATKSKGSDIDFLKLEKKIDSLQRILRHNIENK